MQLRAAKAMVVALQGELVEMTGERDAAHADTVVR